MSSPIVSVIAIMYVITMCTIGVFFDLTDRRYEWAICTTAAACALGCGAGLPIAVLALLVALGFVLTGAHKWRRHHLAQRYLMQSGRESLTDQSRQDLIDGLETLLRLESPHNIPND